VNGGDAEPGGPIGFDRVADRYDETRGGEERGNRIAQGLSEVLNPSTPVLEVGVGTGAVAQGLVRAGFRVFGFDGAPAMAARARERIGGRTLVADAVRTPFPDGSFRQAYSVWLLYLLQDRVAHLREMARVLAPQGRYMVVPRGRPGDQLGQILLDLRTRLRPDWEASEDVAAIMDLAGASGLRPIEVRELPPAKFDQSPASLAQEIRGRVHSILWDVDQETWWSVVEPILVRLDSMPDRPVRRTAFDRILVLERPA
jgi:SAM-dependent methyltransferase